MKYSSVKNFFIILICILSIIYSLPSLISEDKLKKLPNFFQAKKINLGLDLRGGSHLLLKINSSDYFKSKLEATTDRIKLCLRKNNILYKNINSTDKEINITLTDLSNLSKLDNILRKEFKEFDIILSNKNFYLSFNNQQINKMKKDLAEQSIEIIRKRIDETGVKEPIIHSQGENYILLQVAGLDNPNLLKSMLGKTAKLSFHLLDENAQIGQDGSHINIPIGSKLVHSYFDSANYKKSYVIKSKILLSGENLEDARMSLDEFSKPRIDFKLNTEGTKKFAQITRENVGKILAIILDNKVISDPVISQEITGGTAYITGNHDIESARELAILLRSGSLPTSIDIIEERIVGPNLGSDSIKAGSKAFIVGFILVCFFMIMTYGMIGLIADIALFFNMLVILSLLSILDATLTLPGIAGIILTIGMAVDANILFFERIREELNSGTNLVFSIKRGFDQAFSTVFDSNFTTLIAGILLYSFGSGTIRGFAVTLIIGITSSMFTAISLTKLLINSLIKYTNIKKFNL